MVGNKRMLISSLWIDRTNSQPVLDDNSYTSKMWAEVCGYSLIEINTMEIVFLGRVQFNLLLSKEEWAGWQVKLGKLQDYFEQDIKPTTATTTTDAFTNASSVAFPYFVTGYEKAAL